MSSTAVSMRRAAAEWFAERGKAATTAPVESRPSPLSGAEQQFVVPEGFTSVTIEARGARGGAGFGSGTGFGRGGVVKAILSVTPGETLSIFVGGVGANGFGSGSSTGGFNGGGRSATSGDLTR